MITLPTIGAKGKFTLVEPFNTLINKNIILEVVSIRKLQELIDENTDPFKTIYQLVGLTETDYQSDLKNDVPIVVLRSESGKYLYVPANKVFSYPAATGYKYAEKAIVVNLGAVPVDMDFDGLLSDINDLVLNRKGIKVESLLIKKTSDFNVPKEVHDKFLALTNSRITENKSYMYKYNVAINNLEFYRNRIKCLEDYIKTNCCNNEEE